MAEQRVALVTGSTSGIGASVARRLVAGGTRVVLNSVSSVDAGHAMVDELGAAAHYVQGDVSVDDDVRRLVAETVERFGRLDILVANAGVGAYGPFLELDPAHLEEMIDTNLKGTLYAVRAALPHLLESGEADVVTLASEAGRRGLPYEAVYCASKFGQVGFTRALDHELRERGVRCTNVCPGGVATDFALEEGRGRTHDALAGMMTAEDVAEVVLFVLTRPRSHRILETAFRPMTEASWG
jgi:3-oxoacyl-[acyl-carrier protein] reductase